MRTAFAAALAMATSVSGHALMYGVWLNGEDQGDGKNVYIRSPENNNPVKDLTSPDLVCNVNGAKAAPKFVTAAAGDELTFEWYHNTRSDDIIDASHQGPIITYIAEYTETDGTGAIWSKIDESGYDGSAWAVQKLIDNKGKYDFTLPKDLKAGKYLIRQEIIALHEGDTAYTENSARGAQFYPSCVQVEVTGSGTAVPDEAFDFNTGYTEKDAGIVFNLYGSYSSYSIPGPELWTGSGSSSGSASSAAAAPSSAAATSAAATSAAATSVAATSVAPVATEAATQAPVSTEAASPSTLVTLVSSATSAPAQTEATQAPVSTATPPTSSCSRRRRRRSMKNAKKNVL